MNPKMPNFETLLNTRMEINFNPQPLPKCRHCGKDRGEHHAITMGCPFGTRTRIGYTTFSNTERYEPKVKK